jgi:hypothetical protein
MKIAFIHIGKTGGTTMGALLKPKIPTFKEYHLTRNYKPGESFVIWVRNPISRFVSAFNHSYYSVHTDPKTIPIFDLKHCLNPCHVKKALHQAFVFSLEYDFLVRTFESANHLAESLTSTDEVLRTKAIALMNHPTEHLQKGIGWYLQNGAFVDTCKDAIFFVGRLEHMRDDIDALSSKLGVPLDNTLKLRENVYMDPSKKILSELAIKNIIDWYKDTDYKALEQLKTHGWIDETTYLSYFAYGPS